MLKLEEHVSHQVSFKSLGVLSLLIFSCSFESTDLTGSDDSVTGGVSDREADGGSDGGDDTEQTITSVSSFPNKDTTVDLFAVSYTHLTLPTICSV